MRPHTKPELNVKNIVLETDRLIIRGWQENDLSDLNEYASVDGVGQMGGWIPHVDIENSKMALFNFMTNLNVFALELKTNHKVIGSISIEKIYKNYLGDDFLALKGRELGYVLSKDYWGQGLMPEAVEKVIAYLFSELDYDYLMCAHFKKNRQSKSVVKKTGFMFIKEIEVSTLFDDSEATCLYVKYNNKNQ